ncbi:hypothetical protein K2173_028368 [Erythroxylum novogranatense]|uniref:TH1 domain-containing protein n=1 Tax=Erythroxylum novogranatense TaxID=1862640 RepID=A0AAV8U2Z6_9ROSI|nr:hypothetical protein K2173_028368 [Erythroxylum novogranatense]
MNRYRSNRRIQINESDQKGAGEEEEVVMEKGMRLRVSEGNVTENQEPFMGVKVRRKASLHRGAKGDYLDVPSHPYLTKILQKQGDNQVLFADKVLKFTGTGKMKHRVLLITDFAIYLKICLSELSDNFFAIIIPTEYDILMASTRKTEIVTVLVEATKSASNYELDVVFSNSFEYNASAELVKEIQFEEVEGGVKTRFLRK